jgi:predicted nucleotidyltransferase
MNTLAEILSSHVRAEVFRLLFFDAAAELHLREIARRSGLTAGTVQQELARLLRLDLVVRRRSGNRTYYRANAAHPLCSDIRNLVLKTAGLVDLLRGPLHDPSVRVAFVFGSMARGEAVAGSDVDLMVIGSLGLRKLSRLLAGKSEELGREINAHVLREEEFQRRLAAGDHFLTQLAASPKLFVVGTEHDLGAVGKERLADSPQDDASRDR